jgi:undecaprenyl diphosphate synthase
LAIPQHVAIIMDGNGRWAQSKGRPRNYGHLKGAKVARKIIEECARIGIKNLTLYTFSTENWLRPFEEVSFLMSLLEKHLRRQRATLIKNNIRFHCIGDHSKLPKNVTQELKNTIEATAGSTGMNLVFAVSYGGRQEIAAAAKKLAEEALRGRINIEDIDESLFDSYLTTTAVPDPDLIIRTSGEFRISNFMLWQAAYSEFYISSLPWPDFTIKELQQALSLYEKRERRFGRVGPSVSPELTT